MLSSPISIRRFTPEFCKILLVSNHAIWLQSPTAKPASVEKVTVRPEFKSGLLAAVGVVVVSIKEPKGFPRCAPLFSGSISQPNL